MASQEETNTEDQQNEEDNDTNDEEEEPLTRSTQQHKSRKLQSDLGPYWTSLTKQRGDQTVNVAYTFYTASQIIEEPQT